MTPVEEDCDWPCEHCSTAAGSLKPPVRAQTPIRVDELRCYRWLGGAKHLSFGASDVTSENCQGRGLPSIGSTPAHLVESVHYAPR
jgi:hypothetical protein